MNLTKEHIENVCKFGQKEKCCRYLLLDANGFECGKLGEFKEIIDSRVKHMSAQADNCKGVRA